MIIRKTTFEDLKELNEIYEGARAFMRETGNLTQWTNGHPSEDTIRNDIKNSKHYVCVKNDEILAGFYYAEEADPTYKNIIGSGWLNDEPYGVIHRIATKRGSKGVASVCFEYCLNINKNMRIDTHIENIPMQNLLKKLDFVHCGTIYLANGDPREAFQKV